MTMTARAWVELLCLSLIWGAVFLATRIALDEVGVLTTVAHRVFWAAVLLWIMVLITKRPLPRAPKTWGAFLVMGALNNAIPFGFIAWGQLFIESGLTSILNAATAIFGVVLAAICFADERLTWNKSIGVALGFLGVVITIGVNALAQINPQSLGQLAVLTATCSYALAGVWGRVNLRQLDPMVSAMGMLTGASLILVPLALVVEGPPQVSLSLRTLGALGYMSIFATVGAYMLYFRVLSMAGSGNLLLCTLLIPPIAILLGAVVLGETLAPRAFIGFGCLAAGLLILDGRVLRRRG